MSRIPARRNVMSMAEKNIESPIMWCVTTIIFFVVAKRYMFELSKTLTLLLCHNEGYSARCLTLDLESNRSAT